MVKKHQKHTKIAKANLGTFGRNEYAILGTPCGEIKKLAQQITNQLSKSYAVAYVDADHKSADDDSNLEGSSLAFGNQMEFIDKIDFNRFDEMGEINAFDYKRKFINQDLVLINGNHFEGQKQVLVIDPKKSLEKKLNKLSNVALILFQEAGAQIPDYLKAHLVDDENIPSCLISDQDFILSFLQNELSYALPPIHGLVLVGGKSTRMKEDKSAIKYFDKSQKEHMYELLSTVTEQAHYSVRQDQLAEHVEFQIADTFTGLGPYGAILSAFRYNPNAAWLVTACDQPFLTNETLKFLISKRNPSKVATAFYNPETKFPEPLITLWEPRAYSHLLHFLSLGYSCPRKVLINTDIEMVHLEDSSVLKNVNTPEEYQEAKQLLN